MSEAGIDQQRLAALGAAARVRTAMAGPDVDEYTTKYGQKLLARRRRRLSWPAFCPRGAAQLPERLRRDPAVFRAQLSALITKVEGLAIVVNGARCHYADPRVQAAVLVALTKLIAGGGVMVKDNSQTVDSNIGKLFELGALEAALVAMSAQVV